MPRYQCPECDAVLKREQPVPAGKKIKCPKCEFVFAAKVLSEEEEKPRAKPAKAKIAKKEDLPIPLAVAPVANPNDDDDLIPYTIVHTDEDKDKPELYFGSLRDKYAKAKRGPAMAKTVTASNILIGEGILSCFGAIGILLWAIFPLVFSHDPLTDKQVREQVLLMVVGVVVFAWGSVICYGASKLQNLDSYRWSMIGACMGLLPLLGGIMAIVVLRDEEVVAGFEETEDLKKKHELVQ